MNSFDLTTLIQFLLEDDLSAAERGPGGRALITAGRDRV